MFISIYEYKYKLCNTHSALSPLSMERSESKAQNLAKKKKKKKKGIAVIFQLGVMD